MTEFEKFLAANYGLKEGDEIPDDLYDKASSEFRQANSTVPSISPDQSAFDLGKAMTSVGNSSGASQTSTPDGDLKGTPFDYKRAIPLLEQFAVDFQDKENLRAGAKYGDKAAIEADWINSREMIYGPEFNKLGIPTAKAQIAANQIVTGKAKNMFEALGVPEPQTEGVSTDLSLDDQEEVAKLQTIAKNARESALNDELTPEQKIQAKLQAQTAEQRINAKLGIGEKAPYEQFQEIQSTRKEIERAAQLGGGTIKYQGVPVPFENVGELTGLLDSKEKDLLDEFTQNRGLLPVSRQSTLVRTKDGQIDAEASQKRYAEALKKAAVGDIVEQEDGTVGIYGGPKEEKSGGSWVPKPLQSAVKGGQVIAGKVYDKVASNLTGDRVTLAADIATRGAVSSAKQTASAMQYLPSVWLARKGLEYLSSVGQRAEEEEKKKRAGQ